MAVLKIKRPRAPDDASTPSTPSTAEPKIKKIRIQPKTDSKDASARENLFVNTSLPAATETQPSVSTATTTPTVSTPKIRISLKRHPETTQSSMRVKLDLRRDRPASSGLPRTPKLRLKPIRVPGEGYDSESSDIEDDPLIESGIILRVLPDLQLEFIRNSIESGDYSGISIKWKGHRHAVVTINDVMYGAILVSLPTIIEVNKSVDRRNLLKTFDVSQMLLCVQAIEEEDEVFSLVPPDTEDLVSKHFDSIRDEIDRNRKVFFKHKHGGQLSEKETKYMDEIVSKPYDYRHGITPPLYNVRNRRFRRKMQPSEFQYVERVVDMLLREDDMSEETVCELIDESQIGSKVSNRLHSNPSVVSFRSEISQSESAVTLADSDRARAAIDGGKVSDGSSAVNTPPALSVPATMGVAEDEDELDLEKAFLSDDSDEDDSIAVSTETNAQFSDTGNVHEQGGETTAKDGREMKEEGAEVGNGEDEENEEEEDEEEEDEDDDEEDEDEDDDEVARDSGRDDKDDEKHHNELLLDELNELETTLVQTRRKMDRATNPLLKSRFCESIKKLEKEVELKRKQLKASKDQLQKDDGGAENTDTTTEKVRGEEDDDDGDEDYDEEVEDDGEEEEEEEEEAETEAETRDEEIAQGIADVDEKPVENETVQADDGTELDQNDLDMMVLFGAEGDDGDEGSSQKDEQNI